MFLFLLLFTFRFLFCFDFDVSLKFHRHLCDDAPFRVDHLHERDIERLLHNTVCSVDELDQKIITRVFYANLAVLKEIHMQFMRDSTMDDNETKINEEQNKQMDDSSSEESF